jgi:anti-sigma factor RsiW
MNVHLTDDDLVLRYYGEMAADEETRAASHLSACGSCQQQYARLQRVMAAVDSSAAFEAPSGFERTAWARLEPELPSASRGGWLLSLLWSPVRLGWAAAIVVLVVAAFAAGRLTHRVPPAGGPAVTSASAESGAERVLLVDLGDHLDRSQMVLVELASAETGASGLDISNERDRAQQLLASNRLYREVSLRNGDRAMAALLDDLERVLVDVAASPSTMSKDDIDSIRRRISEKELLFKVGVVSSQVRERERTAFRTRRPLDTTKG